MALDDIVQVSIQLKAAAVVAAGFGIPLILGPSSALGSDRFKSYSDPADMLHGVFSTSDAEYKAAVAVMSQELQPSSFVVGRRLSAVAQVETITPTALDSTVYTVTLEGTAFPITSDGTATATEIVTALKNAINGDATIAGILTATGTATLILTANTAGRGFSCSVGANLALVHTTANHGVAEDIADVRDAGAVFYGVMITSRTVGEIELTAAYVEGNSAQVPMFFVGQTSESTSASAPVNTASTDLLNVLAAREYSRTAVMFHTLNGEYADAAWLGRELPVDPGSDNWALKKLVGISPDSLSKTSRDQIRAKNGNFYYSLTPQNPITYEGTASSGDWIDVIRFIDFLKARISERIANLMLTSEKVEFTDSGLQQIAAQIKGVLEAASNARKVVSYTITVPRAADISSIDKAARNLSNNPITFTAQLSGALNGARVAGTVTE